MYANPILRAMAGAAIVLTSAVAVGQDGTVFKGLDFTDQVASIARPGDVNGDGLADLLVGSPGGGFDGNRNIGRAVLVFGRPGGFSGSFDFNTLLAENGGDGSAGVVFRGAGLGDQGGRAGRSVALGDLNGDGFDDVIINAADEDLGGADGRTYVVYGSAGPFPPRFDLASLLPGQGGDGSAGFVILGDPPTNIGSMVVVLPDLNGDGVDDLVLAASEGGRGGANVIYGRQGGEAFPAEFALSSLREAQGGDGSEGFVILGPDGSGAASTDGLAHAGDVNGDDRADIVLAGRFSGESFVLFGRGDDFPPTVALDDLFPENGGDGTGGVVFTGFDTERDDFFFRVGRIGDVNGDGIDDIAVGSEQSSPLGRAFAGEVTVVFGRATFPTTFDVQSLRTDAGGDGSEGFLVFGSAADELTAEVASAGDVNADGVDDIFIGARGAAGQGGRVYALPGRAGGGFPAQIDLADLLAPEQDGSLGSVLFGAEPDGQAGGNITPIGDIDGDGFDDFAIGAELARSVAGGSAASMGETYVIYGGTPLPPRVFPGRFNDFAFAAGTGDEEVCQFETISYGTQGLASGEPVAILIADAPGFFTLQGGRCAGLELGLAPPFSVTLRGSANPSGNFFESVSVLPPSCGRYVQAIALRTCRASEVDRVPVPLD